MITKIQEYSNGWLKNIQLCLGTVRQRSFLTKEKYLLKIPKDAVTFLFEKSIITVAQSAPTSWEHNKKLQALKDWSNTKKLFVLCFVVHNIHNNCVFNKLN